MRRAASAVSALTDLAEAAALAVEQPEAGLGDAAAGVERAEQAVDLLGRHRHSRGRLRGLVGAGHEVAERGVVVVAHRLVQRHRGGEPLQVGVLGAEQVDVAADLAEGSQEVRHAVAGMRMRLPFWSSARPIA